MTPRVLSLRTGNCKGTLVGTLYFLQRFHLHTHPTYPFFSRYPKGTKTICLFANELNYFFREERCNFIRSKYLDRKFIKRYCRDEQELVGELEHAVNNQNLYQLLQVFAEGADLTTELPTSVSIYYIVGVVVV